MLASILTRAPGRPNPTLVHGHLKQQRHRTSVPCPIHSPNSPPKASSSSCAPLATKRTSQEDASAISSSAFLPKISTSLPAPILMPSSPCSSAPSLSGRSFGVVLVCQDMPDSNGQPHEFVTEVATFRSDGAYLDGRHPAEVRFSSSAQDDVLRRDFTINGMMFDPILHRQTCNLTSSFWITLAARTTSATASSAPSANRTAGLKKTSCACCAPSASPRVSSTPSSPQPSAPSASSLRHRAG